jgi:hypothetical protein
MVATVRGIHGGNCQRRDSWWQLSEKGFMVATSGKEFMVATSGKESMVVAVREGSTRDAYYWITRMQDFNPPQ